MMLLKEKGVEEKSQKQEKESLYSFRTKVVDIIRIKKSLGNSEALIDELSETIKQKIKRH